MRKLYEKSEIGFALAWVGAYVLLMNTGMQIAGGFDGLAGKTAGQLLVPVMLAAMLAVVSTGWIVRNGLAEKYGLCAFRGDWRAFLCFIPLAVVSATNLVKGVALSAPLTLSLLMMANMALAGYVEEIVFRGFLFRAMAKENLNRAIIVSAVTFGAGHIINIGNTVDTLGVLLQVVYAIAIGFMYTLIVYKGGSLWPCIISHMIVNGTSVFAGEGGPFPRMVEAVFGQVAPQTERIVSAVLLTVVSGAYALWLWKRAEEPAKTV